MKRSLVTLGILTLFLAAATLAFLRTDQLWNSHRSLTAAASDLWFVVDVALREKRGHAPPPLTRGHYEAALERLSSDVDGKVNDLARDRMVTWGDAVAPMLMAEFRRDRPDRWKYVGQVAEALAALDHEPAAEEIVAALYDDAVRDLGRDQMLDAIGDLGVREVIADLMAWHEHDRKRLQERYADAERVPGPPPRFYSNLGKLGARDFLTRQLPLVDGRGYTISILRGLGYTRDPAALPILNPYLEHDDNGIRQYASEAIDLIEISSSVGSALASFPASNRFEQKRLIETYFSDRMAAEDPRILSLLEALLARDALRDAAAIALARIDTPASIAALHPALRWQRPEPLIAALAREGRDEGFLLLERFLDHPDPEVQRATLYALQPVPDRRVDAWLERKARGESAAIAPERGGHDAREREVAPARERGATVSRSGGAEIAREASRIRFLRDKYELYYSMLDLLLRDGEPDRVAAQERLYDWISKSLRLPFSIDQPFAALHYLILVVALIFGLFLIFDLARAFEVYRFHATLHFLLVAGFLGSFLVVDYDMGFYRYNIGVNLLLLLGYLFMERGASEPGRASNRFGRLAGASLWLVVPSLLYFGTPILADSMHRALAGGVYFAAFCVYALLCSILLLEEYLLPRHVISRSTRSTRWMATLLSTALLLFIAKAVFDYAIAQSRSEIGYAHLGLWMIVPIIGLIAWQWHQFFEVTPRRDSNPPAVPDARLEVVCDREMITVHLIDQVSLWHRARNAYRAVAALYAGKQWWRGAMATAFAFFALIASAGVLLVPLGILALPLVGLLHTDWSGAPLWQFVSLHVLSTAMVLCLLSCARFWSHFVMQIRNGHVRSGHPTLGAVFLGGYWRKRPPCDLELSGDAREWLGRLLRTA